MARPREFDTKVALTDAMHVFWQHGYDAASLPALLDGMGLTRGSLYKAFTDKKSLFLKVLAQYEAESVDPAIALLTTGPADGGHRINTIFESIIDAVESGDHRGCLLCSAAAGPSSVDADISGIVQKQLRRMSDGFYTALSQSTAHARLGEQDRRDLAGLLLSQYVGLRVMVKSHAPITALQESVRAIGIIVRNREAA